MTDKVRNEKRNLEMAIEQTCILFPENSSNIDDDLKSNVEEGQ